MPVLDFFQDSRSVTPTLTLNAGVRRDVHLPFVLPVGSAYSDIDNTFDTESARDRSRSA